MLTLFKCLNPLTIVLLIAVAFVLIRRRLCRELPWFTTYIVYVTAYTSIFYWIDYFRHTPFTPFYIYWGGHVINQLIAFMVIVEVFRNCVRGHDSVYRVGIRVLAVIALLTVVAVLILAPYGSQFDKNLARNELGHAATVLQRSIRVIQIGLLIGIFSFTSYLGLSWRNYNFGIALGYGLYASVNLVTAVAWEYLGAHKMFTGVRFVSLFDDIAYKLTLVLWMTYLWRADRSPSNLPPPSGSDTELQEWSETLKPMAKRDNRQSHGRSSNLMAANCFTAVGLLPITKWANLRG